MVIYAYWNCGKETRKYRNSKINIKFGFKLNVQLSIRNCTTQTCQNGPYLHVTSISRPITITRGNGKHHNGIPGIGRFIYNVSININFTFKVAGLRSWNLQPMPPFPFRHCIHISCRYTCICSSPVLKSRDRGPKISGVTISNVTLFYYIKHTSSISRRWRSGLERLPHKRKVGCSSRAATDLSH